MSPSSVTFGDICETVYFLAMRRTIDDLPVVGVSRLRASGAICSGDATTTVSFPDGHSFVVGLSHLRFPNRGGWSFFVCLCGRRCRTLRLHQGGLSCKGCLEARGLRYRVEDLARPERAAHVASRLKARLMSEVPARLNPRPGRQLDRRGRLAAALWRAEYVASRDWLGDAKT
jgi:hypothetical protein